MTLNSKNFSMKTIQWLVINKKGIRQVRSTKPNLGWDEIAVKINLEIPDQMFVRPSIEAKLEIKDVPNNAFNPSIIINTADLIEQQTGAKINFTVVNELDKK